MGGCGGYLLVLVLVVFVFCWGKCILGMLAFARDGGGCVDFWCWL